jgi:hypothetical protein
VTILNYYDAIQHCNAPIEERRQTNNIISPVPRICIFPSSVVSGKRLPSASCIPIHVKYQWTINLARRCEPAPLCLLLHHKVICLLFTRRSTLRKRFYCEVYRQVLLCGSKQKIQDAPDPRCTNPYPVGGSGKKLVKFGRKLL